MSFLLSLLMLLVAAKLGRFGVTLLRGRMTVSDEGATRARFNAKANRFEVERVLTVRFRSHP